MGSLLRRRCSFPGTRLPLSGSACTGWELASTTLGTPASSIPQCSVSPTRRHLPTTCSRRSTAVSVSKSTVPFTVFCFLFEQFSEVNRLIFLIVTINRFYSLARSSGHQSGFCMICVMQNHIIQAFANTGNAIKPVSFIRDLKSKTALLQQQMFVSEQFFALALVSPEVTILLVGDLCGGDGQ